MDFKEQDLKRFFRELKPGMLFFLRQLSNPNSIIKPTGVYLYAADGSEVYHYSLVDPPPLMLIEKKQKKFVRVGQVSKDRFEDRFELIMLLNDKLISIVYPVGSSKSIYLQDVHNPDNCLFLFDIDNKK